MGVVAFDPKHWSAEPRKQPLPAREDDDLHPSGSTCHDVERLFDTIVVRKDESIIENNCCRPSLIEQELSKPEAGQHCDLFLGALTWFAVGRFQHRDGSPSGRRRTATRLQTCGRKR